MAKARQKRLHLPVRTKTRRAISGTRRAAVAYLLSRPEGATIDECQARTGWDFATCWEVVLLIHHQLGYGLDQDEEGVIRCRT